MSDVTLSPSMTQQDMDRFLSSLGAESNPFTVEDLFAGRKDDVVWSRMQSALNLDNATAAKLALALKQASQQPAARRLRYRRRSSRSTQRRATASRHSSMRRLASSPPSSARTSTGALSVDGDGNVVKQAASWKQMLPGYTGSASMQSIGRSGLQEARRGQHHRTGRLEVIYNTPPPQRGK